MTTLNDGKLTIRGSYGVTVNRGNFSSEKFSLDFGLEYAVEGDSAVAVAEAQAQESVIATLVKEAVLRELGLDAVFTDDGTLVADFGSAVQAAAPSAPAPVAATYATPASAPASGSGGGTFGPPKVAKEVIDAQPVITADLDGRGVTTYRDLRGLKAPQGAEAGPGQYSPRAADFRDLADAKHQVWLRNKDGSVKADVAAKLTELGVAVEA